MDRNLFLPLNWRELKWWVNTAKRLVNDISGGRPCGAHSVVAKVEDYFKDQLSQPFDLTPDLCRWVLLCTYTSCQDNIVLTSESA
jgi:hypothetical protein